VTGAAGPVDGPGVEVAVRGDVLHLELNRPDRKNSLDTVAVGVIVDALEQASVDDSLRAVVVGGRGPDFCSGADWVAANDGAAGRPRTGSLQRRTALQAHRMIDLLTEIQLPVVCAVRGWAAGLGCQIALASDFVLASETSRFWEPFLTRGFTPDSGATWLVPRLIGVARAKEFLLLGRELSGIEAAACGLIHRAVPDEVLDEAVAELVGELTRAATVAVGLAKRCINRSLTSDLTQAMADEALALELSSRTGDFKEGLLAFREHRPADFRGR
jgi:2-(1,2-epoxy-1,2-dihydrophenyl)acetyl-CoA isomerase